MSKKPEIEKRIQEIEEKMQATDFWSDKIQAQKLVKELQELKDELSGVGKYDRGGAAMTIFAGAGGVDSEDFVRILLEVYMKYFKNQNWSYSFLNEHKNEHGGYRNITLEISEKNVYGKLKNESGVHRLVRLSPFNANQKRHTSFAMVEVVPILEDLGEIKIPDDELEISFARSSGPGGQNVNKRDTAVRITHTPTKITAHAESERTQEKNREKALALVQAKLYKKMEEDKKREAEGLQISKTTEIEWGNQIRSYVMHPYQMVKDHRTDVEVRDIKKIFDDGEIDEFIEAEKDL